jgi:hypothetical protein
VYKAIRNGACSLEADLFCLRGRLWVAHIRPGVWRRRSFERLYLQRLDRLARENHGWVRADRTPVVLYLDIKTSSPEALPAVLKALEPYRHLLTTFRPGRIDTGAVWLVMNGLGPEFFSPSDSLPFLLTGERSPDRLEQPATAETWAYHLHSSPWRSTFRYRGRGTFPEAERQRLATWAAEARRRGGWLRFWGGPDRQKLWQVQADAGVQLIHTNKLRKAGRWLQAYHANRRALAP